MSFHLTMMLRSITDPYGRPVIKVAFKEMIFHSTDMEGLIANAQKLLETQEIRCNWTPRSHSYDQRRLKPNRNSRPRPRDKSTTKSEASRQLVYKKFESYTTLTTNKE